MSKQFFWLTLLTPLLLLCFLMGGCAVLSPVGKAIASGYDNMVAYFNTYYDAKQTFDEAEEDTKAFLLTQRGKEVLPPLPAFLISFLHSARQPPKERVKAGFKIGAGEVYSYPNDDYAYPPFWRFQ